MKKTLPAPVVFFTLLLFLHASVHAESSGTAAAPAPASKPSAVPSGKQINIETKFMEVSEETCKGIDLTGPARPATTPQPFPFADLNNIVVTSSRSYALGGFPELKSEKESYADFVQEMTGGEKPAKKPEQGWAELGVLTPAQVGAVTRAFGSSKEYNLLSAPSFTVKSGNEGKVAITHPMRYASAYGPDKKSPTGVAPTEFATKDVGITLQAKAEVGPDNETINLDVTVESVTLLGYLFPDANNVQKFAPPGGADAPGISSPVFSTKSIKVHEDLWDGQTVLLGAVQTEVGTAKNGVDPDTVRKVRIVTVTAHIVGGNSSNEKEETEESVPMPSPAASPKAADQAPDSDIPYGLPIDGKPGFVKSPYAPDAGEVDLRGYSKGTQVRDPYTQKVFLVP